MHDERADFQATTGCRLAFGRALTIVGTALLLVFPATTAAAYSIGGTAYTILGSDFNVMAEDYDTFNDSDGLTAESATAHLPFADAAVSVDLATGTLKGSAIATGSGYGAFAQAYFSDEFWLVDVPAEYADQTITATVSFRFEGVKDLGSGGHAGVSALNVFEFWAHGFDPLDGGYIGPCTGSGLCSTPTSYLDTLGAFDVTISREIVLYDPFIGLQIGQFGAAIQYAVNGASPGITHLFDFSHTGTLDIVLPSDLSWTSASGVLLTNRQVTEVPEPSSLLVFAAGLGILAAMHGGAFAAVGLGNPRIVR